MDDHQAGTKLIDDYIAQFSPQVQDRLTALRKVILTAAPGAAQKIAYRMPTFVLHGNLVHFAAYGNHIGFYPTPSAIEEFRDELAQYKWAKGSVRFPLDEPMPLELIDRMVRFRVRENAEIAARKTGRDG
jgi:uncharacterized protein YdhG (YjbR/CyaY superfamily)